MSVFVKTENKGTLNMRSEPKTGATIIARIPYGTEIPAEKLDDTWAKVRYNNKEGYVMHKFLSTEEPATSSQETVSKEAIQKVYNSLKATLKTIEEVLK